MKPGKPTNQEPKLAIIPATKDHLSHIIMLAHRIWPVSYKDILTQKQIDNLLLRIYSQENLQDEMKQGHNFWIAYQGDRPAGYVSVFKEGNIVWLKKLYVDVAARGNRIGVQLLYAAVSAMLPAMEIQTLVNKNNLPAQGFYAHLGFSKIGEQAVRMGDYDFVDFVYAIPLTPV
jgi:ribosomal protein S18 acetylase RimI-like enzyme